MTVLSNRQLDDFEMAKKTKIPEALRVFLTTEGPGTYDNLEIYDPDQVEEQYGPFFDDPADLFSVYLPFGDLKLQQELLIFRVTDNMWARIWHEYIPEMWPEQDWQPFTEQVLGDLRSGT